MSKYLSLWKASWPGQGLLNNDLKAGGFITPEFPKASLIEMSDFADWHKLLKVHYEKLTKIGFPLSRPFLILKKFLVILGF